LYNPRRAIKRGAGVLPMNLTDYLVIVAIVLSAVIGAMRGFLREIVALVTWLVALFIAWHYYYVLGPHLGGLLSGGNVWPWAARAIIVVLVLLIGAGLGAALGHFVRLSLFSGTDRLLGFAFGGVRGFVLLGIFVILGQLLRLENEHWWHNSLLLPYGESVANGLRTLLGEPRHIRHAAEDERIRV